MPALEVGLGPEDAEVELDMPNHFAVERAVLGGSKNGGGRIPPVWMTVATNAMLESM